MSVVGSWKETLKSDGAGRVFTCSGQSRRSAAAPSWTVCLVFAFSVSHTGTNRPSVTLKAQLSDLLFYLFIYFFTTCWSSCVVFFVFLFFLLKKNGCRVVLKLLQLFAAASCFILSWAPSCPPRMLADPTCSTPVEKWVGLEVYKVDPCRAIF